MSEPEVKPEDVVSKIGTSGTEASVDLSWLRDLQEESTETDDIEEKENKDILKIRHRWADWILFLIVLIVLFDMLLVILIGTKQFDFTDPSIVIAVITDNFLKIVGLGYLITREIFRKIYPRK